MFTDYKATDKDFEAIEEGIQTVWHSKLNFVFKNKKFIKTVNVVSYDSKNLYLWSQTKFSQLTPVKCNLKQYFAYKIPIPHQLKLSDDYQYGWRAGLKLPKKLTRLLLSKLKTDEMSTPFISGGLLMPFTALQKKMKDRKDNPYVTRESYLATIVHENTDTLTGINTNFGITLIRRKTFCCLKPLNGFIAKRKIYLIPGAKNLQKYLSGFPLLTE